MLSSQHRLTSWTGKKQIRKKIFFLFLFQISSMNCILCGLLAMYQNLHAHDWVMAIINVFSRIIKGWNPPNTWFQGYFFDINYKPPPILNKITNLRSLSFSFMRAKLSTLLVACNHSCNCFAEITIFILLVGILQSVSALLLSSRFFLGSWL